jgi:hypothetical protein
LFSFHLCTYITYVTPVFSALPKEGPEITGEERIYQVGDVISLNCTSGKSFPPAKLKWYINGSPVSLTSHSCDLKQLPIFTPPWVQRKALVSKAKDSQTIIIIIIIIINKAKKN